MFDISDFGHKIKIARLYRGYKWQNQICLPLNINKQTWSLWEKGQLLPTAQHITAISNFLEISPLYFFSKDTGIQKYDILYNHSENISLPFVETTVTRRIEKIISSAIAKAPSVYLLTVYAGAGITRAIFEALNKITDANKQNLIIFDNNQISDITRIKNTIAENPQKSIMITGVMAFIQQLKKELEHYQQIMIDNIQHADFVEIVNKALPDLQLGMKTLIISETCFSLTKLALLVKKLRHARIDNQWEMSFDSILSLCDNINKTFKLTKEA